MSQKRVLEHTAVLPSHQPLGARPLLAWYSSHAFTCPCVYPGLLLAPMVALVFFEQAAATTVKQEPWPCPPVPNRRSRSRSRSPARSPPREEERRDE